MKTRLSFLTPAFLTVIILLSFPNPNLGQAPNLGTASNFILFTTVGAMSNTGVSQLIGNVGSNDGAITGFENLIGEIHNADAITQQCSIDVQSAYNQLNSTVATFFPAPVLGNGQILYPGVYAISQAGSLNADLTLDAQGDSNAVFIFHIAGAFSTNASSRIILINGALASNVFWKVEGAASMATGTTMRGTVIAHNGAFSMGAGDTLDGRGLSTTGAVSVYGVIIPVTLINFQATKTKQVIGLLWTTANEFSFARYELERSADGRNFYNIGSVPATNTPFVKSYNWTDDAPLAAVNFYRLKMIDIDGVFKYSVVVKIDMNAMNGISVYPNPVTGHVMQLQMYGQLKGDHIINLYNNNGEKVMSSRVILDGNDEIRSVALDKNLLNGIYYLEISDPEKNKKTLKILIN